MCVPVYIQVFVGGGGEKCVDKEHQRLRRTCVCVCVED